MQFSSIVARSTSHGDDSVCFRYSLASPAKVKTNGTLAVVCALRACVKYVPRRDRVDPLHSLGAAKRETRRRGRDERISDRSTGAGRRCDSLSTLLEAALGLRNDLLERRKPLGQLGVDVGFGRAELGIEVDAVRASLHGELLSRFMERRRGVVEVVVDDEQWDGRGRGQVRESAPTSTELKQQRERACTHAEDGLDDERVELLEGNLVSLGE